MGRARNGFPNKRQVYERIASRAPQNALTLLYRIDLGLPVREAMRANPKNTSVIFLARRKMGICIRSGAEINGGCEREKERREFALRLT